MKKLILTTVAIGLTACATNPLEDERTKDGALIGAGTGAAAGAIIAGGGNRTEGALIGAGVGAVLGGVVGNQTQSRDRYDDRYYDSRTGTYQNAPADYRQGDRFYDSQVGEYYYRDPATGAEYYESGRRRN